MQFRIEYSLTRAYPGLWLAPSAFVIALVALGFLVPIEVALVGYETVSTFRDDFNFTQSLWYDKLLPWRKQKPGTVCSGKTFNPGDRFTTNYGLFEWTFRSVEKGNRNGLTYAGDHLDICDITAIYINGDIRTWTIDVSAELFCKRTDDSFEVKATTDYSVSALPGKRSGIFGTSEVESISQIPNSTLQVNPRVAIIGTSSFRAAFDVGNRVSDRTIRSPNAPITISLESHIPYCPAVFGESASCATSVPSINVTTGAFIYQNNTVQTFAQGGSILGEAYGGVMSNFLQATYSAMRLDLGNPSPNNIFLSEQAVNNSLQASFSALPDNTPAFPSRLASFLADPASEGLPPNLFPLNVTEGPAFIRTLYACNFIMQKSHGTIFMNVLVAVLALYSTGWSIFTMLVAIIAKRYNPIANACEHHCGDYSEQSDRKPSLSRGFTDRSDESGLLLKY